MTEACTSGMTYSQPGVSVSTVDHYANGKRVGVMLNVRRHYEQLTNDFGGKGRIKRLDHYGMVFESSYEAFKFAKEKGYIQDWHPSYGMRLLLKETTRKTRIANNKRVTIK